MTRFTAITLSLIAAICLATSSSSAQTYTVIHSFTGPDGATPLAGLAIDRSGNLYGTTLSGGNQTTQCPEVGCGTVFRLSHAGTGWVLSDLYKFSGGDGFAPQATLTFGPDGTLYGTTGYGGSGGEGTVFNLRPPASICRSFTCPWSETILFPFGFGTGYYPTGDITFDSHGNIYGTTRVGGITRLCEGIGCGTVYQLVRSGGGWTENILYEFDDGEDGQYPNSGVVLDGAGNLYGTAPQSAFGHGLVFDMTPSGSGWSFNVLNDFQGGTGGQHPWGGLIFDAAGNLYGATSDTQPGQGGTVFELSPLGASWSYNILTILPGSDSSGLNGPWAKLVMDSHGNLYGTTVAEGAFGYGNVFKLTPAQGGWTYTSLYDFTGQGDGKYPYSALVLDANGNLYGTTEGGGLAGPQCVPYYCGVVFEITP